MQYRPPSGDWTSALVNEPVAGGVALRTASGGEAEWRGPGERVAVAPSSELQVLRLDGDALQLALPGGRIGVHLDAADAAKTVEIDMPQGGVWLNAPGDYEIAAGDAHTPATVQVFTGKVRFGGGLDESRLAFAEPDAFSEWFRSRDDNAALDDARRPGPEIPGLAALGEAGRWELDPVLGKVWYPSDVAADWAPYRDGVWRYLAPWGWTWIDDAAWGFAPSHYGRWALIGPDSDAPRWGWVPGPELRAADYSPAQVAFLGTAGIGLSRPGDIGASPAVAWFPLAPGENIGAASDADGSYRNRRFATAVPRNIFAAGLPVADALVDDVPAQRFIDAPIILHSLNIPPGAAPAKMAAQRRAATPPVTPAAASEPRPPYVVALRDIPPRAPPVPPRKPRVAVSLVAKPPHPLAGTPHPPHNRQHLAAARGGA